MLKKRSIIRKYTITTFSLLLLVCLTIPIIHADDTNNKEFGIWWINNYSPPLQYCDDEAIQFKNYMISKGYTNLLYLSDSNAKENHFECSSVGGIDTSYSDSCDFFYFCGHGSYASFTFSTNYDGDGYYTMSVKANAPNVRHEPEWGDTDLEWAFLQCCKALSSSYKTRWDDAFIGLHGICGFHTDAVANSDGSTGYTFAYYLTDGNKNILNAWKFATQETQPTGTEGAIYRAQMRTDQMQLIDYGSEYINNMYYDYGVSGSTLERILYTKWQCGGS